MKIRQSINQSVNPNLLWRAASHPKFWAEGEGAEMYVLNHLTPAVDIWVVQL